MATAYKVLGQVNPSATTLTTLYTVPASTSSVASTLTVCNLGLTTNVRVAVRPTGEAIANKHYLLYDAQVNQLLSKVYADGKDVMKVVGELKQSSGLAAHGELV